MNYTIDVFGGERRTVEGLRAQVDVQHYTALATYLTLTSNAVNTVIAEAGYRDQIKATEEMIRLLKDQVRITETQVKAGTVPYSNLLSVQSQLAAIEATLPQSRADDHDVVAAEGAFLSVEESASER